MKSTRRYTPQTFIDAIRTVGRQVPQIAAYIGCSKATVYSYLRLYPDVKAMVYADQAPVERTQYSYEVFKTAISKTSGLKSEVLHLVGCSRKAFDDALERWPDLVDQLESRKGYVVNLGMQALVNDLEQSEDKALRQAAYKFVLPRFERAEFAERQEVTGSNGQSLFSPEVLRLIEEAGIPVSEVARQFEMMVRTYAAQSKDQ